MIGLLSSRCELHLKEDDRLFPAKVEIAQAGVKATEKDERRRERWKRELY
jgi:hypothetical protein